MSKLAYRLFSLHRNHVPSTTEIGSAICQAFFFTYITDAIILRLEQPKLVGQLQFGCASNCNKQRLQQRFDGTEIA